MGKGTKTLLFGCLGLVAVMLLAVVFIGKWAWEKVKPIAENPAQFVAEQIVKAHPELETVSVDKSTHSITFRDKASGEVLTARLDKVQNGNFILTKSDGTEVELGPQGFRMKGQGGFQATLGGGEAVPLPDWVPPYPGPHTVALSTRQESNGSIQGVRTILTTDDVPTARAGYLKALEDAGYTLHENGDLSVDGRQAVNLKAGKTTGQGLARTIVIAITDLEGKTQVGLNYDQSTAEK
ncbi:MAG: hypothetical protein JWM59_408 [Verrucomicrobiales bacterium]|nr:hypothetical protein [Verrucomicrobiales bacterium]